LGGEREVVRDDPDRQALAPFGQRDDAVQLQALLRGARNARLLAQARTESETGRCTDLRWTLVSSGLWLLGWLVMVVVGAGAGRPVRGQRRLSL
jgi:hypothetical protein